MLESASQCNRRVGKITPSRQAALVLICLLTLSATAAADSSVKKQQGKTTLRLAQASEPQVSPAAPAPSYPPSVNTSILRQGTQLIDAGKQQEAQHDIQQ